MPLAPSLFEDILSPYSGDWSGEKFHLRDHLNHSLNWTGENFYLTDHLNHSLDWSDEIFGAEIVKFIPWLLCMLTHEEIVLICHPAVCFSPLKHAEAEAKVQTCAMSLSVFEITVRHLLRMRLRTVFTSLSPHLKRVCEGVIEWHVRQEALSVDRRAVNRTFNVSILKIIVTCACHFLCITPSIALSSFV